MKKKIEYRMLIVIIFETVIIALIVLKCCFFLPCNEHFEYLKCNKNDGIDQIVSKDGFKHINGSYLYGGATNKAVWMRFREDPNFDVVLIKCFALKIIEMYVWDKDHFRILRAGWGVENSNNISDYYVAFRLPKDLNDSQYIYLKMESPYPLNFEINLYTNEDLAKKTFSYFVLSGLVFGAMFVFFIYYAFVFFILKDQIIGSFSLMIFFFTAFSIFHVLQSILSPRIVSLFFPTGLVYVLLDLYLISELYFIFIFLDIKNNLKTFYIRTCPLMIIIMSVPIVCEIAFGPSYYTYFIFLIVFIIFSIYYAFVFVIAKYKKIKKINLLLVAVPIMAFGGYATIGIFPNMYFKLFAPIISICFTAVILTSDLPKKMMKLIMETSFLYDSIEKIYLEVYNLDYSLLKAQIRKHLLFDALDMASGLCITDQERARILMINLSSYLRNNFDFSGQTDLISIHKELENLKLLIELEKAIYGDNIAVSYCYSDFVEITIPNMILIEIIEKAVSDKIKSGKKIEIDIEINEDKYFNTISVIGNVSDITDTKILSNIGKYLRITMNAELIIMRTNKSISINIIIPKEPLI